MKKAVIFICVLLLITAALFGASAYWFGMQAEQQYKTVIQKSSKWAYVKLTNEEYNRGLFSSKAKTMIELSGPSANDKNGKGAEPFRFTLAHEIKHGPLLFEKSADGKSALKAAMATIETTVALQPETQEHLHETLGKSFDPSTIKEYTTIRFGGSGDSYLIVPAFDQAAQEEQGGSVKWEKLAAQWSFTPGFKSCKGSVSEPGVDVNAQVSKFALKDLESNFDFHEGANGLLFGDASWTLGKLEYMDENAKELKHFLLTGLSFKTITKPSGDNIESSLGIRFDQSVADDAQYGPGNLSLELRNLDAASMAKLKEALEEMKAPNSQQGEDQGDDNMLIAKYMEILPGLLKKSPEIELSELNLKSSKGDFFGKAKISFDGKKKMPIVNPIMLLNAVAIQAEFSITEGLLEGIIESRQAQEIADNREKARQEPYSQEELKAQAKANAKEQLDGLIAQKILIHEDGKYKASASYRDGEAELNGQPLPLQELLK